MITRRRENLRVGDRFTLLATVYPRVWESTSFNRGILPCGHDVFCHVCCEPDLRSCLLTEPSQGWFVMLCQLLRPVVYSHVRMLMYWRCSVEACVDIDEVLPGEFDRVSQAHNITRNTVARTAIEAWLSLR